MANRFPSFVRLLGFARDFQSSDTSYRYEQVSPFPGDHLPARPEPVGQNVIGIIKISIMKIGNRKI